MITALQSRAFRVDESLFSYLRDEQQPFFETLGINFHTLYHIVLPAESLVPKEDHCAETRIVAVCSKRYHIAHDPHSVLNFLFVRDNGSGGGLPPRTASAVLGGRPAPAPHSGAERSPSPEYACLPPH